MITIIVPVEFRNEAIESRRLNFDEEIICSSLPFFFICHIFVVLRTGFFIRHMSEFTTTKTRNYKF